MAEVENANVSEDGKLVSLMQASSSTVKKDRANQVLNNVHTSFKQKIDAAETTVTVEEAINPTTNHNFIK